MSAATLPSWLDPQLLQWIIIGCLAFLAFVLYLVLRFVRRILIKGILLVALVGLGASLWIQRSELADCARTCECRLYGQEVVIPADQIPENLRLLDSSGDVSCVTQALAVN